MLGWRRSHGFVTSDKISLWGTSLFRNWFIHFSYLSVLFREGELIPLYYWCNDICHLFRLPIILRVYQSSFDRPPVTSQFSITARVAYGYFVLNIQNMKRALYKIRTYRALNIVSWYPFFLRFYWDSQWLHSSRSKKPRGGLLSLQIWQTSWLRRKMYR